jgi:hypothetical protein
MNNNQIRVALLYLADELDSLHSSLGLSQKLPNDYSHTMVENILDGEDK